MEESEEEFEKHSNRIEKAISIIRGRIDLKSRLSMLLNPDKVQTTTELTKSQVRFTALSFSAAQEWKFMRPLKDYATHLCLANISLNRKGVESAIRFTGALAESKLLQRLGVLQKEGTGKD